MSRHSNDLPPNTRNDNTPGAPAGQKFVMKHWRFRPVLEIMRMALVFTHDGPLPATESAWADFPFNGLDQYDFTSPQVSLAGLFWEQDISRIPKSAELMAGTADIMSCINRENRLTAVEGDYQAIRLLRTDTKQEIKTLISRHYKVTEMSNFSDIAALLAMRYTLSWRSSLSVEVMLRNDPADRNINSTRFSRALGDALSAMAWTRTGDPAAASAFYQRASGKIPKWQRIPDMRGPGEVTPHDLYLAIEYITVVALLDLRKAILLAIAEIVIEDPVLTQDEYECLLIFYYSLGMARNASAW